MASLFSRQILRRRQQDLFSAGRKAFNSSTSSSAAVVSSAALNLPDESSLSAAAAATSLNLDDSERLFSSIPTGRLLRATANLHAAAIEPAVDLGIRVMRSKLMTETRYLSDAVFAAVRHTFYQHFCAGEDAAAASLTVARLHEAAGIRGMLVYALEYASDNHDCDRNLDGFIATVHSTKSLPSSSVSFIIVKITAICPMRVLERASDLLRWQHKDPSFNLPWKQQSLPIFASSSPTYHTQKRPDPLTPEEERDLELAHRRLLKLCKECAEANVPLSVDAEHTVVQPVIDYLTYAAAVEHNRDGNTVIYGTMQAYLKDARERLGLVTRAADEGGVAIGFKVVRGAYMSSEASLAASLGYPSPVHDTIQDTHDCYNDCASFMLERVACGQGGLVLASHNVESGKLAAAKAHGLGIEKVKRRVEFAQLYGMAEALSFGLRNSGFQVSKYMPFGPIDLVMPYLLRRAEENRGLLSASSLDRQLMRNELKRRLKAAIF